MNFLLNILFGLLIPVNALVEWRKLDDALKDAKEQTKPIMFLMTKDACKPCKKLSEELDKSPEFEELRKDFSLARAIDDELPKDEKFNMDGKYVPKIVFLTHHGEISADIVNIDAKSEKAKYFYSKVEHVLKSMNTALEISNLDNGFGKDYQWYSWENGLKAAGEQDKPILLIFHQDWCGACARLKPQFAKSNEVKELASNFIMINTDREELVKGDKYKADGEYYPKTLFLNSDGELMEKEWNHETKHPHVKHYYGNGAEVAASMKRVMENTIKVEQIDDKGFGKHIKWVSYETGLKLAKEKRKPIMLIIHKSYCGACKALKPRIRNHKEIGELSKQFIMVHTEDDDEPTDDQFDIDGAYIPRIFFLDSNGRVNPNIRNNHKDFKETKYAYGSAGSVVEAMKQALGMNLGEDRPETEEVKKEVEAEKVEEAVEETEEHEDGFGPQVKWFAYEEGLREAKKSHKVSMLVFYNNYCEFSKFMKLQLHEEPIVQLSKKFVMIRIEEEEAKALGDRFDIDGTYTPRIIFMDPDQNIHADINNTDTAYTKTMFYYGTGEAILSGMQMALTKINLTLGNGFGEYIDWVRYEKALELANETNTAVMLIIHKSWCGACNALKPKIKFSRPIWELSQHFIMANVEDESEPLDNQYFIDGGYYPRIFFIDPAGKVDRSLHNRDPAFLKHKYSYATEEHVLMTMKYAAAKYAKNYTPSTTESTTEPTTESTASEESSSSPSDTNTNEKTDNSKLTPGKSLLRESGVHSMPIDEALDESKTSGKPIMFIIHRTTCPACKALLKMVARDPEFKTKAAPFIVSDIEDDVDEQKADSYDVDGGYVPRIYFLDSEGEIFRDVWNIGTNYVTTKYYYYDLTSVYRSMDKAISKMETWSPGQNKVIKDIKVEL